MEIIKYIVQSFAMLQIGLFQVLRCLGEKQRTKSKVIKFPEKYMSSS